ncbi:hypothetical protein [Kribbella sp. NPDC004536]|uniref:hypothetical protein n=1 Tax=Kribbella sp. NPDC004536 TaxID=3364106 RepID=UPI00368DE4D0
MTRTHLLRELLHYVTHRVPGVAAHAEKTPGHQGTARHGRARPNPGVQHRPVNDEPPRVLVGLQRRIAALFGQESR